jgi:nitrite reductase/ring-hydroxylating ferredoxin subunit
MTVMPAPLIASSPSDKLRPLCNSHELIDSGDAVPFDVVYAGQTCRAFAVRYLGQPQAYLNRCTHVAMEMDYQPNKFYDLSGTWLICATHGAYYQPDTGRCAGGPCRGGLVKIQLTERDGVVHWHTADNLKPLVF